METPDGPPKKPPAEPSKALVRRPRSDVVPRDTLQRYMDEVRQYDLMSREEEHEVAKHYKATGDSDAAFRLVTANLRLVVKIAMEYHHTRIPVIDLVQEGNVGLMLAVKKYDPFKGVRFGSYAQWWIRAYILKFLMDNFAMVKVGTTQAQRKLFYNLKKERGRLEALGIDATTEVLADNLGVKESEVREMQKRLSSGNEVSIHTPLRDGEAGELMDMLPGDEPDAEDLAGRVQLSEVLHSHFDTFRAGLDERGQFFWEKRLISEEPWTLQKLGDHFGVSRERARQIEARILRKLKEHLKVHMPDLDGLNLTVGAD